VDLSLRPELIRGFSSYSQVGRVLTQDWVGRQLPCLSCSTLPLIPTPQNTKSRDFDCTHCGQPYELKSTSRKFGRHIPDGEYRTFCSTIEADRTPNLLLMEYDLTSFGVRSLTAIHRRLVSECAVIPRKPLSASARRAGWQGCSLDLASVPSAARIQVVAASTILPWNLVLEGWSRFDFMVRLRPESRGWLRDVLALIERLPPGPFGLGSVYQFESELQSLHPSNQNVRPKIRQQLQLLVAAGLIRREARGEYSNMSSP
jgi:type II restriction enzyme